MNAPKPSEENPRFIEEYIAAVSQKTLQSLLEPGLLLGAECVLIWSINLNKQIQLSGEIGMKQVGGRDTIFIPSRLKSLGQVFSSNRSSFFKYEHSNKQVTCFQALLQCEQQLIGVVELLWTGDISEERIAQASGEFASRLANQLYHQKSIPPPVESNDSWTNDLNAFMLRVYSANSSNDVAFIAANEGRQLLDIDRLIVASARGSTARIRAITGQPVVQYRSPSITALQILIRHLLITGEEVKYCGTMVGLPTKSAELLSNYVNENRSRMLWVVPLRCVQQMPSRDPLDVHVKNKVHLVGFLVLEKLLDSEISQELEERTAIIAEHVSLSLFNCNRRESIFLLPVWESIGRSLQTLSNSRRNWIVALACATVGLVCLLVLLPWEYKVTSLGKLMPVTRADLFAPWNAEVLDVFVEDGQKVEVNQPLLQLRSDELSIESVTLHSLLTEKRKLLAALQSQIDRTEQNGEANESIRLQGEAKKTEIEIDGTERKLKLIQERLDSLLIKSPVSGTVTTFQLRQLLLSRPVQRGDRLMQVMDTGGKWRLELDVPEHHSGHVLEATKASTDSQLKVEFVLATAVESSYEARLESLATRTDESESEGSVVEAIAVLQEHLEQRPIPGTHVGAEVIAKIHCGKKSLGYCLFGDAIEFVRRKIWF